MSSPEQTQPTQGATPRTDAYCEHYGYRDHTLAQFARTLELQLTAALAQVEEQRKTASQLADNWTNTERLLAAANAELAQLRARLEEVGRDGERLKAGLQWYADGNHCDNLVTTMDTTDWDNAWELEEGWLCAPHDQPWMVEPGNVARAILNGQMINPDSDADLITVEPSALAAQVGERG